ncbi:hypothetical protein [Brasilonema sp. UFV-L1]|uniref:hypothetical protein n=1 Tax=Brasilonema sp. UFV-L1 TaxID=2234130 RepID=UPI00145C45F1|nr:hypothetical protein [Brasilonema sp. UFV-L1]NMG07493.1 hypothetical protein [Brasilonema sp. UFV-L1]
MQPGILTIYRLEDNFSCVYRLVFTTYEPIPSPKNRETCLETWRVDDIEHWHSYVKDNFEYLGNDYYLIPQYYEFSRLLRSKVTHPNIVKRFLTSVVQRAAQLSLDVTPPNIVKNFLTVPNIAKFLLVSTIIIIATSIYLQWNSDTPRTHQEIKSTQP